ncbi:MAG: hypothetical protein FWE67_04755 [Planctomycetaceae bacterium]|nr:hypothetical protein [Planctomycetaceae bacterium]
MTQSKLLQFAEVCLGSYYSEFKQALDDSKNEEMNTSEFLEKYPMFKMVWAELKEIQQGGDDSEIDDCLAVMFLLFAEDKNVMFRVDWSGEDETGDVAQFVGQLLQSRNITGFEWDTEKFDASLDWKKLGRGDYILLLFKAVDKELQKIGNRLTFFFMGDDSYPFTVLNEADFDKVNRLAWSHYGVYGADTMNEYQVGM